MRWRTLLHAHALKTGCILVLLSLSSCNTGEPQLGTFDALVYEREGGGEKEFTVVQSGSADMVTITVSSYAYRDTLFSFSCSRTASREVAFAALDDALQGRVEYRGYEEVPTAPTGTWTKLFLVRDGLHCKVTSGELKNRLKGFEEVVQGRLPQVWIL
jgi:hypothetical protein